MSSSKFIKQISREYSLYVNETRAIPNVVDSFKEGQRIALWLIQPNKDKIKTITLAANMMAKLYQHGDASAAQSIQMLAAPYNNNNCYIEGHGNFGTKLSSEYGAPRYTSVRRSKYAEDILYKDLDILTMKPNYDGSAESPIYFLPLLPIVLHNGISGMGVGFSCQILPRSLKSLIQATIDTLNNKPLKNLLPYYENYDIDVVAKGDNKYELIGKVDIVDTSTILIKELPPGIDIENLRKRLNQMEEDDQIIGYEDKSAENVDILVKFKRGTVKDWTQEKAIDFFKLREKKTERIVVVGWDCKTIITYDSPEEVVKDFVQWRLSYYKTRYEKLLKDTSYDLIYWQALRSLFKHGFAKKLGGFISKQIMSDEILKISTKDKISVDEDQLNRILNLATYRWTKDFETEVSEKISELENNIMDFQEIIGSPELQKEIYISELEELKKLK